MGILCLQEENAHRRVARQTRYHVVISYRGSRGKGLENNWVRMRIKRACLKTFVENVETAACHLTSTKSDVYSQGDWLHWTKCANKHTVSHLLLASELTVLLFMTSINDLFKRVCQRLKKWR